MHLNTNSSTSDNSQKSEGLMPDSSAHIARLEARLSKLKKNDPNKVTGKDLISSMSQFKEIYMNDYFRSENKELANTTENAIILESVNKSYLEKKLLPEQPINTEEIMKLVDNDWLNKPDDEEKDESASTKN